MSDTDRRRKMISLRLSEVEYEVLKAHYRTYGARNISELARLALHRIMNGAAGPHDDIGRSAGIEARCLARGQAAQRS